MPENKPIDEVLETLNDLVKDVKSIKNDVSVIKNRLHELNRDRINKEQQEADDIAKGWGLW